MFSFFLKELVSRRERTLLGSWVHALHGSGDAECSFFELYSLVRGVNRMFVVADRRTVCRDVTAATGRRRSVMYAGALPYRISQRSLKYLFLFGYVEEVKKWVKVWYSVCLVADGSCLNTTTKKKSYLYIHLIAAKSSYSL